MRSRNKALAYLCALTLLFSYAEMILPRFLPFFRLGLANTVMLLALDINLGPFVILSVLKATVSSLMGGTLFSPFFLISLLQSVASALFMKLLYKLISRRAISLYGISVAGSALSAVIQISLAALYTGKGTFALLGPMLIFNTASGILTAFFCEQSGIKESLHLSGNTGCLPDLTEAPVQNLSKARAAWQVVFAVLIIANSVSLFFIKNLYILCGALVLSLIAQKLCKRKIYILPHLSLWLFVFISAMFIPNGKVLFRLWKLSVTQGALLLAAQKALTLSAVSALSQCAVRLRLGRDTLLGLSLEYYRLMSNRFRECRAPLIKRILYALNLNSNR